MPEIEYICDRKNTTMKPLRFHSAVAFAFFMLMGAALPAQDEGSLFSPDTESSSGFRPTLNMDFGSSFATAGSGGHLFTQSIAPRMNWDMSQDFRLSVGTVFSSTRLNGMPAFFPHQGQSAAFEQVQGGRMFSSTLYAVGSYQVNPRLSILGAGWVERSHFDMAEGLPLNPYASQYSPHGMMLGFDYKVSENFRFGAEVNVSRGHNPFSSQGYYHSPFGGMNRHHPFHRQGWW